MCPKKGLYREHDPITCRRHNMGTFSKLAEIIMEDIRREEQEEEEAEELACTFKTRARIINDEDSCMIAHAQYEDDQLNRYLEATSIMTDEDAEWLSMQAAADRCVSVYKTIFKKAMSQYE